MLKFIEELPTDYPIGGVHCVPVLDNGSLIMVWFEIIKRAGILSSVLKVGRMI